MFQVQCLESAQKAATENVAKFCIEPLSKGQGITIGNALRRNYYLIFLEQQLWVHEFLG
jgi:DNA-directed RNA polymerase alpha subunit